MVSRQDRDVLIDLLVKFFSGDITNYQFEEGIPDSEDSGIWPIVSSVWCFYDDTIEHKVEDRSPLSEDNKEMFMRWILFLKTDNEYEWPPISYPGIRPLEHGIFSKLFGKKLKEEKFISSSEYEVWPFYNKESYEMAVAKHGLTSVNNL
jgi:hypothetical protein